MSQWYGYMHINRELAIKKYNGLPQEYIGCYSSPYIRRVIEPFEAENKESAKNILKDKLIESGIEFYD